MNQLSPRSFSAFLAIVALLCALPGCTGAGAVTSGATAVPTGKGPVQYTFGKAGEDEPQVARYDTETGGRFD